MSDTQQSDWLDELLSEFDIWCKCGHNECVKFDNFREAKALIEQHVQEAVVAARQELYEGGEKKFIAMLLEQGLVIGQNSPDFALDSVLVRIPRDRVRKYFDGELSNTKHTNKEVR